MPDSVTRVEDVPPSRNGSAPSRSGAGRFRRRMRPAREPAPPLPVEEGRTGPRHPEIGVVGLVDDLWSEESWQARHHILSGLGQWFNVVWLDPALEWRESWRADAGPRAHASLSTVPGLAPGFRVLRPGRWLPNVYRPRAVSRALNRARLRLANRTLRRSGARRILYHIWRPEFGWALDVPGSWANIYHLVDEYSFSPEDHPTSPEEGRLLRSVDRVIIHSPGLLEKKGGFNPATSLVPNGVDYEAFVTPRAIPADLASIPGPRVGYVGWVKEMLDVPLLVALARRHAAWSFVLVGPVRLSTSVAATLRQLPNVYLLGSRPRDQVPAYVQHMDVCTLPYRIDGYTKYIYPLKLHEYLAAGRPVVATPIRSLRDFPDLLSLAPDPEAWTIALQAALGSGHDSVAVERRRRVARQHDWSRIIEEIAGLFLQLADEAPTHLDPAS